MSINFQSIKGDKIPSGSIVLMRSDNGFSKQVVQAVAARLPADSILLCLRPNDSVEFLDEAEMRKMGWQRIPKIIVPSEPDNQLRRYPRHD